ncbi:MAG: Ig-like domain-containing protein [Chthoniobacteraceae bacterium]
MNPIVIIRGALWIALTVALHSASFAGNGQWTLIGWNNLGMHCMDDDYSIFTILPPFNTVDAQLIDGTGKLVLAPAGITLTYQAIADPDGSINRTAAGKSNFWDYVAKGYGAALPMNAGLGGNAMPGTANTPQPLTWVAAFNEFEALGIPIIPVDDAGRKNAYPMMRLTARNSTGTTLATTDIVLPVSSEMDCRACHASGSVPEAMPLAGWVNDPVPGHDYRLNILRLHDEKNIGQPAYQAALVANGFRTDGLFKTVTVAGTPILCAKCHSSEALGTAGAPGVDSLTRSMHARHATVKNPANGLILDNIANRSACYTCHPGSTTRCLRGAMGAAVAPDGSMAMQCQSCHGTMSQVGALTRTGWLDEPGCQSCHTGSATQNNGQIRYTSALETNGSLRAAVSTLFATNADTPAPGKSLYRFSKGHGGLQCEACHGSTHAEFPSAHRNDNIQSVQLQGHVGALMECTACHASMPNTTGGGPHGMHTIGATWINNHPDIVERGGNAQCKACHGTDLRGTVLSRAATDRSFSTKFGTKTFYRGYEVSCYTCHNGGGSSDPSTRTAPVVANASLIVPAGQSASLTLNASGTAPVRRIIRQPSHGAVALNGAIATYFPDPGFVGYDSFAYTASDAGSYVDALLPGFVSVTVGTVSPMLNSSGDGIPDLIKYALGLSSDFPCVSGATSPVVEVVGAQKYLTMNIARYLQPSDVALSIEVSGDLLTWSPATVITNSSTLLKVRDPVAISAASKRFMRVKATKP